MPRARSETPVERPAAPRRRREAGEAREAILDVTERQLVAAGPSGIRLQEVAREAGVSHPTVLHHFGSREALVKAVIARSLQAINAQLVRAIEQSTGDEAQLAALLEGVFQTLSESGHGRVLMWLALEGHRIDAAEARLGDVVDATHALRKVKHEQAGCRTPSREDTAYAVVLAALALLGSAVVGPTLLENAGLPVGAATGKKFRAWVARLLVRHLDSEER